MRRPLFRILPFRLARASHLPLAGEDQIKAGDADAKRPPPDGPTTVVIKR